MTAEWPLSGETDFGIEMPKRLAVTDHLLTQAADKCPFVGELSEAVEKDLVVWERTFRRNRKREPVGGACPVDQLACGRIDAAELRRFDVGFLLKRRNDVRAAVVQSGSVLEQV